MRILHITDSHGIVKSPEGRRDIYYITFLKKLYELGYICKKLNVNMVVHTGDLFHTARVSNKFAGQISELIKAMGVPFYVVPGNHDIEGYTINTIDQTMLGLLSKTGVINLLDREHPISITDTCGDEEYTIAISGQEYYAHIDEGNMRDFEMQQDEADLNILAIHGYIADTPQHPNIKCTMVQDIITDADIILTGHYHRQFEWWDGNSLDIYNPGSMMRVEQTEYNRTHMPMYGILDIGLNERGEIQFDYKFHKFMVAQPSTTVFDYESKYKQKMASITLDGFKTSLENTMSNLASKSDIRNIIKDLCIQNNMDLKFKRETLRVYDDTLQSIPDEFEAPSGYVEAQVSPKIKSVTLENFQSHAHTKIEFDEGLNIIVGESNNGKTAIIRAIMWVIDNQPLGTDFIMAGENACTVRIDYDDGTYIERGRTRKDTGYYKVGYFDENNQFQDQTYRGFTNAIPIEVTNIHQMPKVNITKDIETHLNVLSQLDAPFLITESPQVKAAAIGRITGTHVIDAAVKSNNKLIKNNKAIIKDVENDIKSLEVQISGLPDIKLTEAVFKEYSKIIAYLKALDYVVNVISQYVDKIRDINLKIDATYNEYKRYRILNDLKCVVDEADSKYKEVSYISSALQQIQDIKSDIVQEKNILEKNSIKASLLPVVNHACQLDYYTKKVTTFMGEIKLTNAKIKITKERLDIDRKYSFYLRQLMVYIDNKVMYISKVEKYLEDIEKAEINIKSTEGICNSYQKRLMAAQTLMDNTLKEKLKAILSNGVCPCCRQPISSEEHANHINIFMEEQKIV